MIITADGVAQSAVMVETSGFNNTTDANVINVSPLPNVAYVASDYTPRHGGHFNAGYLDGHIAATNLVPAVDIDWAVRRTM